MQFKSFMEALKGNQHKIDKNKNGKIDAHDFKLLQKEEAEELEEASVKSEKHSWGKMMTVHHGASHSYPLHPEHQEAIRNLKHGEKTSFKDETGAKVNVHRDVQDVHFTSNKTSTKTTVPHSHFSEETEDRMARADYKVSPSGRKSHKEIVFTSGEEDKTKETVKEEMTDAQMKKREEIVKSMKKDKAGFKDRYGDRAETVMYATATKMAMKEEAEELDEKSDQAKQNKTMKNMMDASRGARFKLNNPVPDAEPEHKTARAHNVAIGRALRKEEKKENVPFDGPYTKAQGTTKDKSGAVHTPMSRAKHLAKMAMKKQMKEDIDRLFEKDDSEYNYEGEMAVTQLKTISRHAEALQAKMKPDTNLPEWVQSKITLATDYMQTAHDYLMSELDEQAPVAPVPGMKFKNHAVMVHPETKSRVVINRKNIDNYTSDGYKEVRPGQKLKEDEEVKFSYTELMMINEIKLADLPVRRIKGHSYGADYSDPEGADDYDDKKPMKPTAEKRGRGRPAGSQSGARKNFGSSKLHTK
jgi:hypothetical protein